jgi:penicillin-binding protein 1A
MSEPTPRPRTRKAKNTYTTRSGKTIKLNRSLGERVQASKEAKARRKAAYLSTLPKEKWKRILYRIQPKRLYRYWFSRDGAIMALKVAGVGFVIIFLVIVGLFAYFRKDLPKIKDIAGSNFGGSITYYDRSGQTVLWQDYDAVKRVPVESNQIAEYMKEATVAVEDKDFYHEGAFNVKGITRAAINDLKGGSTQGGSTITQQLVKLNEGWTNDHTISRKIKELILAVELEREYNKDDILTGYLNIAPYGNVDYGVESAARDYFGISASQLTLAQSALLASIPKAPTAYSPFSSPTYNPSATANYFDKDAALARQHYVLDQMAKQGYITQAQADAAKKVDILAQIKPLQSKYSGIKAPYFVLTAKQELENRFGATLVKRGGWKVTTTLDLTLQDKAEALVQQNIPNITRLSRGLADEEALVLEDVPTGQIVALVGGTDFTNPDFGQNNYASGILIPPGSSFKPYDYTTFINNNTGVGAGSVLYDSQGPLPGYPCTNRSLPPPKGNGNCLEDYDFIYPGPITLRYALGGSRNVPAVKAMLSAVPNDPSNGKVTSVNKVISTASAMMDNTYLQQQNRKTYNCYSDEALTQTTQCYGAAAIGDGAFLHLDDHVNGLATLGRLGKAIPKTYLLDVTTSSGKSILKWTQPKGKQVVKPDSAYIVNDMASDPNASYLPGSCSATNCTNSYKFHRYEGWHFAIKTGTTNDGFDGLMTSWSTKYAVVTWVGNHMRNRDISAYGASMEYFTEPLAKGMMQAAHDGLKPVNWVQPADIKVEPAFVVRNHIHYGDVEPSPSKDLFPSWYIPRSNSGSSQTIDKVSGKLATSCTPTLAREVSANSNVATWNVDIFMGGSPIGGSGTSGNQAGLGNDDVHACGDESPSVNITAINGTFTNDGTGKCPDDASTNGCDIKVLVSQGTHPLNDPNRPNFPGTLNLLVNGHVVQTQAVSDSGNYDFLYKPDAGTSGTVQISVQVIDSVLDSGTANGSLTLPAATKPGHGNAGGLGGGDTGIKPQPIGGI